MKSAKLSKVSARKAATRLEWALQCARRGLRVHPLYWPTKTSSTPDDALCSCPKRTCGKRTGKHPLLDDWQEKATVDEAQIEAWWSDYPEANVGIYAGTGELVIVDVDGAKGRATIAELEREHGLLPTTFTVATGQGVHLYFAKPAATAKIKNSTELLPGIDVRSDGGGGGYGVGPGSLHWSGVIYDVEVSSSLAPIPHWLLALVLKKPPPSVDPGRVVSAVVSSEESHVASVSMDERVRRAHAYVAKAAIAVSGDHGHRTAMRVATAVVRGFALPEEAAREVLEGWNLRCAPPWSESELSHKISEATRVGAMSWGAKLIVPVERFAPQSIVEFAQSHPRDELSYLLPRFKITSGRATLLGGFSGVGKTLLAQQLALAVVTRRERCWGGVELESAGERVLHLDYEMGGKAVIDRYRRLAAGMRYALAKRENLHIESMPRVYLSDEPKRVEAALLEICDDYGLVIVDNLRAACPHAKSENDSAMRLYLDVLTRVSEVTGCLFMVVVHEGKQQDGSGRQGIQRVRGSGAIVDAAGAVLSVGARRDGSLRIEQTKSSLGPPGAPVHVRLVDRETKTGRPALEIMSAQDQEDATSSADHVSKRIVDLLEESPGLTVTKVLDTVRGRRSTVERALNKLREAGVIVHDDGAKGAKLLRLARGGGDDGR